MRTAPAGSYPPGPCHLRPARPDGPAGSPPYFFAANALYQSVVWDFGRVMGSHQARLRMS
jgi:hypothetical protein